MAKKKSTAASAPRPQESRAAFWQRQIEECATSGLTQAAFCEERDLSVAALRGWKWKLKSTSPSSPSKPRAETSPSSSKAPRFLPVRVVPSKETEADEPGAIYELVLRGGQRIRVPADFEPAVLHRLILTVEATGC